MEIIILAGAVFIHAAVSLYQAFVIKNKKINIKNDKYIQYGLTDEGPIRGKLKSKPAEYIPAEQFEVPIEEVDGKIMFDYEVGASNLAKSIDDEIINNAGSLN
jgi:hypothetical protein